MCFPQHVVTVELDTSCKGCKGLLLISSVFIVTKIQKRPNKLHHSFSEEYFPDGTVQIFFAKSSEETSPISIVKSLTGAETLGDFFPVLSIVVSWISSLKAWRWCVQPGGSVAVVGWRLHAGGGQAANKSFPSESSAVDAQ